MTHSTPLSEVASLNLEFYRKQAKALLRAARSGDREANDRLKAVAGPKTADVHEPALHMAQRVIARDNGFSSWPRFQAFITESRLDFMALADRFIDAATSDGRRARDLLADHPDLAQAGFYVALVLGDWEKVAARLEADPELATRKSGPENVEPIIYVCFSRFAHPGSERAAQLALTLRLLLRHGADANAAFASEHGPLPCLYAAAGLNGNAEMTRILLDAGADPNDGESLYHACEHADLSALKVLLEHGGDANSVNVLKHMLDWESPEGVRLLLNSGADPNAVNPEGDTALHWAVRRGRSAAIIRLLLVAGVDMDAARNDGRTAYAMAVVSGQAGTAEMLAAHGADTRLGALDAFIAGESSDVPPESAASPTNARLLSQLAESGNAAAVAALVKAGVPAGSPGDGGITALHYACWRGDANMIDILVAGGAPLNAKDQMYNALPSGFLHHGSTHCGLGNYAASARLLIAAGASMEGCDTPSGNAELDAVLREYGLI
ncbi:MAG: ankyrin repeat domain-containing protein [Asticcacaulis sp.]